MRASKKRRHSEENDWKELVWEDEETVIRQQIRVLDAVRSGHSTDEEQEIKFQVAIKGKLKLVE